MHSNIMELSQTPSLLCTGFSGHPVYPEATSACRGYLLDAGCDPTAPAFSYDCRHGGVFEEIALNAFVTSFLEADIVRQPHPRINLCSALTMATPGCYEDDAGKGQRICRRPHSRG